MPATEFGATAPHSSDDLAEADRLMTICNSCRYCEGLCAVFPAMEMRRAFADGDLNYLANLCHGCGACYHDCQFSPPHEFNVNVPRILSRVRAQSYASYAWPRALSSLFARNGLVVGLSLALAVAGFLIGFTFRDGRATLFGAHAGPGAFYDVMPHGAMVVIFGGAFLYALLALVMAARHFWQDIGEEPSGLADQRSLAQAMRDALALRYLDGGGLGCMNEDERPTDRRRFHHHLTFYGFLACFAATSVATLYHYLFGREAPYPIYDLPVLLGTLGGVGLVIGCAGLFAARWRREPAIADEERFGMDVAFIAMLFLTGASGLALLALRATVVMGIALALHLGVVFALFITMPYGKFVHGIYRFLALLRYAKERRNSG
ncbi:MAG: tricarballylate utilization 4Fe-4S protein TcuB [Hyphomicrobiales bacterium]|nr:tricarballylate utilization 4Fe-4S protein TcuB [Hyphomicrobiales bacterium]